MRLAFLTILYLSLILAGCGGNSSNVTSSGSAISGEASTLAKAESEAKIEARLENEPMPTVTVPEGPPPKKLVISDLREGRGATARPGDRVGIQFRGLRYSTGVTYDSYWVPGEAFRFTVGSHQVIEGWEKGVVGMKVGGRRKLIVPPALAYGSKGYYTSVDPGTTLVFVISLVGIK